MTCAFSNKIAFKYQGKMIMVDISNDSLSRKLLFKIAQAISLTPPFEFTLKDTTKITNDLEIIKQHNEILYNVHTNVLTIPDIIKLKI